VHTQALGKAQRWETGILVNFQEVSERNTLGALLHASGTATPLRAGSGWLADRPRTLPFLTKAPPPLLLFASVETRHRALALEDKESRPELVARSVNLGQGFFGRGSYMDCTVVYLFNTSRDNFKLRPCTARAMAAEQSCEVLATYI
jgi:hypothetical protein